MKQILAVILSMLLAAPAPKPILVYMAGAGERGAAVETQRETLEQLFPGYQVVIPDKTTEKYDIETTAQYLNTLGKVEVLVGFSQGAIGACQVYALLEEKPKEVWLLGASSGVTDRQAREYAAARFPETKTYVIMGKNEQPERQARGKKDAEIMGASFDNPRYIGHDAGKLLHQMSILRDRPNRMLMGGNK